MPAEPADASRPSPSAPTARLLITARGLRSFAYSMLAVVLGLWLARGGLSPPAIGALITVSLLGDFCGTYVVGLRADQWGRRRTLLVLALLMALTGAIFGLTTFYPVLLAAAFCGTLGTSASETAPFLPIEQAMLSHSAPAEHHTALFARYNLVASFAGALGALAAGLPNLLAHRGVPLNTGIRFLFGLYVALALLVALLALRLSPRVEGAAHRAHVATSATPAEPVAPDTIPAQGTQGDKGTQGVSRQQRWHRLVPPLGHSQRMVLRLAGLFSVDALAGGLVVQSLMALYFHLRFGVDLALLGVLFFGANALSALSFLAASPLARRFGLLNTMVFTHLPSNVLLALVAVMPTFPLAAGVLLARQVLSQMDVPTRQVYTMALVAPESRTAAASVTSLARSAGSATSPVVGGVLLQGPLLVLGLPFMFAGTLKGVYDLTLWSLFRRVRLPDAKT
jgi:MFS family permease